MAIAIIPNGEVVLDLEVDIKPKSCPNPLNVKSKGKLPVAILGTPDLDVKDIDIATLELNGVEPIKIGFEAVTTPAAKIDPCDCEALEGDSFVDCVLKFRRQAIIKTLGEVQDGDIRELTLTGRVKRGQSLLPDLTTQSPLYTCLIRHRQHRD